MKFCFPLLLFATTSTLLADIEPLLGGPSMHVLAVEGALVTGKAPSRQGSVYSISDGSNILWKGNAEDAFSLTVPPGVKTLYLLSDKPQQDDWQLMGWSGEPPEKKPSGTAGDPRLVTVSTPDELYAAITTARQSPEKTTISMQPGVYRLFPGEDRQLSLYISNHDQQNKTNIGIPLVGLENTTLEGNGSTIVCHGNMLPMLLMDSRNVTANNLNITYNKPFESEGIITSADKSGTTLKLILPEPLPRTGSNADSRQSDTPADESRKTWEVRDGHFHNIAGETNRINHVLAYMEDGRMVPTGKQGDILWNAKCEQIGEDEVKFSRTLNGTGLSVGHRLVLRNGRRPNPAILIYRSKNTRLENVRLENSQGMGILAQRSENVTIEGGGCIKARNSIHTTTADATHFSNCRGDITVRNATFESMMDDAINVHSTCLRIERIHTPTEITCRYMHRQAVGFETFLPGEKIQFIKAETLENTPSASTVIDAQKINERQLRLHLSEPLPEGIGEGDAIENADWYPQVTFSNNIIRYNRARGALFTTPRPVRIENNRFEWCSGEAILLAGDAQGWYESGRCLDIAIRNNTFDHCFTNRYQFTKAIITIYPEVKNIAAQAKRYHQNITITDNIFKTHRVPLLYGHSVDNLRFYDNSIIYDEAAPAQFQGKPFLFQHSENLILEQPGSETPPTEHAQP